MRSSMRRSTPAIGDATHGSRAAWTATRREKSALSSMLSPAVSVAQLADVASPLVQYRQDVVGGFRHQADIDPCGAEVAEPSQLVDIVGRAADRDRQSGGVAPGLLRHLAKGRQVFLGI